MAPKTLCLLIAHIAQQAKPWLCLGHPAGGRLLQGGAQCSKETLERAVQKCECPCELANELVRTTGRLSTHNAQHTTMLSMHNTQRSSQCLLPPPLRALLQLSRLQATTHPARSILSPPLSDPFLTLCPPAVVVVWHYHILCNSKRLKYCYCCLTKEQAGSLGPDVFDRNNA